MGRLNLTSSDARTRVKAALNQRYREVASSVNVARTRRGTVTCVTASGSPETTVSGVAKIETVFDQTHLKSVLSEVTLADLRARDASGDTVGIPYLYAVVRHRDDVVTLRLFPEPTQVATLHVDALLAGTEMTDNGDIPSLPTDYHDILVQGALVDELLKMEKSGRQMQAAQVRFDQRVSELRYFLHKSAWLSRRPSDAQSTYGTSSRVWPYSNLGV